MNTSVSDPYYSRTSGEGEMIPRQDPTVWGDEAGPLTETQLADFRRDGFLFFPSLLSEAEVDELKAEAVSLTKEWH